MVEVCGEGDLSGEFWVISDSRGRWRDVEICRDLLEISGAGIATRCVPEAK
jgi:hypothetical protein